MYIYIYMYVCAWLCVIYTTYIASVYILIAPVALASVHYVHKGTAV